MRDGAGGRKRGGMSAQPASTQFLEVAEYLATEPFNLEKREYLAGVVYDMAGTSEAHNVIASNLAGMLYNCLRGKPCQPFGDNMQLRLRRPGGTYFYYPDAMIVLRPDGFPRPATGRNVPRPLFEILV